MAIYIIFLIAVITSIAICVALISKNAKKSNEGLKSSFLELSKTYNGSFVDEGSLKGLSTQINVEGFDVIVKTFIKKHRKYVNWYAVKIIIFIKNNNAFHQKELSIADAVPHENLLRVILAMIAGLR